MCLGQVAEMVGMVMTERMEEMEPYCWLEPMAQTAWMDKMDRMAQTAWLEKQVSVGQMPCCASQPERK